MRCYFTKYKEYFKFSERCFWSTLYQTMRTESVSTELVRKTRFLAELMDRRLLKFNPILKTIFSLWRRR